MNFEVIINSERTRQRVEIQTYLWCTLISELMAISKFLIVKKTPKKDIFVSLGSINEKPIVPPTSSSYKHIFLYVVLTASFNWDKVSNNRFVNTDYNTLWMFPFFIPISQSMLNIAIMHTCAKLAIKTKIQKLPLITTERKVPFPPPMRGLYVLNLRYYLSSWSEKKYQCTENSFNNNNVWLINGNRDV